MYLPVKMYYKSCKICWYACVVLSYIVHFSIAFKIEDWKVQFEFACLPITPSLSESEDTSKETFETKIGQGETIKSKRN